MENVTICGIPHKVIEVDHIEGVRGYTTQGEIDYPSATIRILKSLPEELKKAVLFHEVLHGMLVQLGYNELSEDERFVCALSNAMYSMFQFVGEEADQWEVCCDGDMEIVKGE